MKTFVRGVLAAIVPALISVTSVALGAETTSAADIKPAGTEIDPAGNTGVRESPPLPISNPEKKMSPTGQTGIQINGNVRISSPRTLNIEAVPVGTPVPRRPKEASPP